MAFKLAKLMSGITSIDVWKAREFIKGYCFQEF